MAEEERNLASGGMGGSMRDVRSKFSVDTSQMEKLVKGFSSIKKDVEWMNKNLDATISKVNKLAAALAKVNTAQATPSGTVNIPANNSTSAVSAAIERTQNLATTNNVSGPAPMPSAGGAGGFFKNFRGGGVAGMIGSAVGGGIGQAIAGGIGMIDARVNAGYGRALEADRLAVLYQQAYGITNNQYANMRRPLAGAMLGPGGVNTLLGLQAQTGLQAQRMAPGVEALRVASGFSLSTQDVSQLIRTLASPMVNNRMTMTLGTGIYGPGGSQRNPMQVVQQIVRGSGLTNERVVNSGMQQGSVVRARLTAMGVPEDMQDIVLQYAKENIQYQKRTGKTGGMYDPGSAEQRRLMGVDKNFATEKEVTDVRRAERDEQFYRRQADNYAALERNTQRLIDTFAALEDRLSGLIGARTSTRGNPLTKLLGGAMVLGGGALAAFTGPTGIGPAIGMGLMATGAATMQGDPGPENKGKTVLSGYDNKRVPMKTLENSATFSKLNPKFKERLLKMMQANPNVGIGQGYRSSADQRRLFLSRYSRTNDDTGIRWDGAFWKKNGNVADAAPPGLSMHEIGLAADLVGDLDWVQQNAHLYGLKTFGGVNNEPWHVQPAELPNGRGEYEKNGAPWGTIPGAEKYDPSSMFGGKSGGGPISDKYFSGGHTGAGGAVASFSQMSLADSIAMSKEINRSTMGGGSSGGGGRGTVSRNTKNNGGKIPAGRTLSGAEVAKLMYAAGFRGADLVKAVAIAKRESSFRTNAHNPNSSTGDNSFGLMQINMIGALGPDRRRRLGLKSDEELFDPATNARAAYWLYQAGKNSFYHWGEYKGMSATDHTDMKAAKKYVQQAGFSTSKTGDGMSPARSTGSVRIDGGNNITIAPNIYFQSTGSNQADAHRAAKEVSRMFTEEMRLAVMRAS